MAKWVDRLIGQEIVAVLRADERLAYSPKEVDVIDTIVEGSPENEPIELVVGDDDVFTICVKECEDAEYDGDGWRGYYRYVPLRHGPLTQAELDACVDRALGKDEQRTWLGFERA